MRTTLRHTAQILGLLLVMAGTSQAQSPAPPGKPEFRPTVGPTNVSLGDNLARLALPEGFAFIDAQTTKRLLKEANGVTFDAALGMIIPTNETDNFSVVIQFEDIGYVSDSDAGKLDADGIFKQLKEGAEESNEERKANGFPPLELLRWSEVPRYEKAQHSIVWGLVVKGQRQVVNYNTRILGRRGVLSLNMVTKEEEVKKFKPKLEQLLAKITYLPGQTYGEYVKGKDKDSNLTLTGLVLGGGALAMGAKLVKMGLLAKFSKVFLGLLLAFKKFAALIVIAIFGLFKKLFGGKSEDDNSEPKA
jgi:uncharacterized membrane-anchored protein